MKILKGIAWVLKQIWNDLGKIQEQERKELEKLSPQEQVRRSNEDIGRLL